MPRNLTDAEFYSHMGDVAQWLQRQTRNGWIARQAWVQIP